MARVAQGVTSSNGNQIARMEASLFGYNLTRKGDGYHITFHVDLADADEVVALNAAIQKLVVLTIEHRPKRARSARDDSYVGEAG